MLVIAVADFGPGPAVGCGRSDESVVDTVGDRREDQMLARQDAGQAPLFEIAADVATMLRGVHDWSEAAPDALARIGAGMGLHRAFIFQVHELLEGDGGGGGRLAQTCRYDWAAAGLARLTGDPKTTDEDLTNADEAMMRLAQRRRRGDIAHGLARDVEGRLRAELDRQGIRAFLSVPLTVSGRWWGHLGFADCERERSWSPSEIGAARLIGELFATAIERSTRSLVADAMSRASMLNAAFDAIVTVDEVEHICEFNPAAEVLFGLSRAEVLGRPLSSMIVVEPGVAGGPLTIRDVATAGGAGPPREVVMRKADGTPFPVEISATEVRTEERRFFTAHLRDVTERRRTIEALAASEAQFRALVEDQSDVVTLWDAEFGVTFENRAFREQFGLNFDREGRRHASVTIPPDVWERLLPALLALTPEQPIFRSENRKYPRSGEERLYAWTNRALFDEEGVVTGYLSVGRDITEQRRLERALEGLAYVDAATGLPNRNAVLQRFPSWDILDTGYDTVVAVRLREFGDITASFGHAFSDRLLAAVAKRLQAVLEGRSALARVGENWFAVLSRNSQDGALALAHLLREAFVQPFELEGRRVPIGASFGIARRTGAIERLLEDAEIACQSDRPGAVNRFDAAVRTRHLERLEIEADLRDALADGRPDIDAAFQPIFDLASNALVGFEALARWKHPERGSVPPAVFVPIAEATGLILPLGERVLELAASRSARWREMRIRGGRNPVYVSVNLSAHQIADPELAERVAAILARSQADAGALSFEITEGTLMSKSDHVIGVLRRLKKLGAGLAIDDFGTGYSSFGYLHQFPIDSLKIDRSFVSGMTRSPNNREIVRAMIELGHGLGLSVVAEGIEEWETRDALLDLGCDHGQGFLLGRPMSAADADAVVELSLTVA